MYLVSENETRVRWPHRPAATRAMQMGLVDHTLIFIQVLPQSIFPRSSLRWCFQPIDLPGFAAGKKGVNERANESSSESQEIKSTGSRSSIIRRKEHSITASDSFHGRDPSWRVAAGQSFLAIPAKAPRFPMVLNLSLSATNGRTTDGGLSTAAAAVSREGVVKVG